MKVEKKIYYHANSNSPLKVGDILKFDVNTKNKMYEQVYNTEYKLNDMDANSIIIDKKRNHTTVLNIDELKVIGSTVNSDAFILRELALESVRKEKYSNYPSRLSCLYLTEKIEDAINWASVLKRNQKECKQILTLEVSGDTYCFDGNLMRRENISYQEQLNRAKQYWNSTGNEILFLGEAKVIKIDNI